MHQGGERGAVCVGGAAPHRHVVQVAAPGRRGEGEQLQRAVSQGGGQAGRGGEGAAPGPQHPGEGGGGVPGGGAVQHAPRAVGEGEGGGQREREGRALALHQQGEACTVQYSTVQYNTVQHSAALEAGPRW